MNQLHILGIIVLMLTLAYIGLTFYSIVNWNETVSATLIGGFIAFAQSTIRRAFDLFKAGNEPPTPPDDGKVDGIVATTPVK
jgi:hypothetical protein